MKITPIIVIVISVIYLFACSSTRSTKDGYRIKGKVSKTILVDKNLKGKCKISGYIYSRDGKMFIESANITISKNKGTTSDSYGRFSADLDPGNYNIQAEYVGHDVLETGLQTINPNEHLILIYELGATGIY